MAARPEHRLRTLLVCLVSLPLALACRDNPVTAPDSDTLQRYPMHIDLGTLGGASSYANDISRNSTVVGSADNAAGLRRAFRWTALAGMEDLGTLPGDDWSDACCISENGSILGVSGSSSVSTSHGTPVVWSSNGTIGARDTALAQCGVRHGERFQHERGDVVGWDVVGLQHAWIWSSAQGKYDITANVPGQGFEGVAGAVDGNGLVLGTNNSRTAGCFGVTSCWRPFLWSSASGYRELGTPEADSTSVVTALGLSNGPTVVGWARTNALGSRPYVWREGEGYTILPTAGGGYATSVNTRGVTVGVAWHPELSAYQATVWRQSGGAVRLSPSDPNPQVALAVNEMDVVVGWSAQSSGANHATVWLLGPASSQLVALATSDARTPAGSANTMTVAAKAAGAAATACLSHPEALVSRSALFACVARGLPSDGHPR